MTERRKFLEKMAKSASLAAFGTISGNLHAAQFPSRGMRVVTPFSAGAGPDATLRVVAERLSKKWSQPVVIDNRPGGAGFIAYNALRQGAGDGHDLIQLEASQLTTHPHTFTKLPYDVEKDFAPICMMLRSPFFVAVASNSPYSSLEQLVEAAQAKPDSVTYGSWGIGSIAHIGALRLEALKNARMLHVPFRDFASLYTGVATGQVDFALATLASGRPLEQAGRIKYLAFAGPKREPSRPNVPSTKELPTLSDYEVSSWVGLLGPKSMPTAAVEQVWSDYVSTVSQPEIIERYRLLGYEAPKLKPAEFAELIRQETASWKDIIRKNNIKLD